MIEWLKLSDADRLISLQQANIKSGIAAKVIEKDWLTRPSKTIH